MFFRILFFLCLWLSTSLLAQETAQHYFPLAVGNFWEFEDSYKRTLVFKVSHQDDAGFFRMMNYQKPQDDGNWTTLKANFANDFLLLHERDESIVEENAPESYLKDQLLPIQIEMGKEWEYRPSEAYDVRSGKILGQETQKVPAGTFENCLKVKLIRGDRILYLWFARNVGWVHIRFEDQNDESIVLDWQLSKYKVARHVTTQKYEKPQEVFDAFQRHLVEGAYIKAYNCLSQIDRDSTSVEEFLERMKKSPMPTKIRNATLKNLKIQGTTATGSMIIDDKELPLVFIFEEDSWRLKN